MWTLEIENVELKSPNQVRFISRSGMLADARRKAALRAGAASALAAHVQRKHRGAIKMTVRKAGKKQIPVPVIQDVPFPVRVTVTRISASQFDKHDNIRSSCKQIIDGLADALGIRNDSDERVEWRYAQEKCARGRNALRIEVCSARPPLYDGDATRDILNELEPRP